MCPVAQTSAITNTQISKSGKKTTQKQIIMTLVQTKKLGLTRREISIYTGLELGAVAGRCNEMVTENVLFERPQDRRKCRISKRMAKVVKKV